MVLENGVCIYVYIYIVKLIESGLEVSNVFILLHQDLAIFFFSNFGLLGNLRSEYKCICIKSYL